MKIINTIFLLTFWTIAFAKDSSKDSGKSGPSDLSVVNGDFYTIAIDGLDYLIGGDIFGKGIIKVNKEGKYLPDFENNWIA